MIYLSNRCYLTPEDFPEYIGKNITLCITNECNLRCSYCYIHNKNSEMDMTLETAKRIIDKMFENPQLYFDDPHSKKNKTLSKHDPNREISKRLVFDLIGGEPLIRPELLDAISDYIKYKNIKEETFYPFMFSISTNGTTYLNRKIKDYIKKNNGILSIGITIDGTKKMHDACRVFPNGIGSYDIVRKSVDKWITDFPDAGTKVTIVPENLPFLAEAIIHLWKDVGIQYVPANTVFENVWTNIHPPIFERELNKLKNFLLADHNYTHYTTTLFSKNIGSPIDPEDIEPPCGGNGSMIYWHYDGTFYNCIRYSPTSCKDGKGFKLGNIDDGWIYDSYQYLVNMNRRTSSDDECFNCEVASGCFYCPGAQFDFCGDPNVRSKNICDMHKARVKISNDFFAQMNVKAKEVNYGENLIFLELDNDDKMLISDLKNKMFQLKNFLLICNNYPDISHEKLLKKYYEYSKLANDFYVKVIKKHLKGVSHEDYNFDWSRGYAVRKGFSGSLINLNVTESLYSIQK